MKQNLVIMGIISTILSLIGCSRNTKKYYGKLSKETEEKLTQSIDAFKNRPIYKKLTERANKTFQRENPKNTQHQDGTIGFSKSYDDNPLNKFDDEFYKVYDSENLQQLQIDFIRKHKTEFIDN